MFIYPLYVVQSAFFHHCLCCAVVPLLWQFDICFYLLHPLLWHFDICFYLLLHSIVDFPCFDNQSYGWKASQVKLSWRATNTHLSEFELSIQACVYNEFWIAWSVCLASIIEHLILALCMRFFYSKLILYTYVCMCACRHRERERERERIYSSRFINMCAQVLDLKSNTVLFCTL